jgi:peptide chain release factor 1
VQCQDQKSQHKNKDKAFGVLRSRLYEQELAKKQAEDATKRTSQVSSGDRSAKIVPTIMHKVALPITVVRID